MEITERISRGGASESAIRDFEARLGVVLPEDYRRFLATVNGGRPKPRNFDAANGDDGSLVHFFFTLDPDAPHYQLTRKIETYTGRVPDRLLPIGCDDFGNLVLLDVGGAKPGAVYFWDHERENPDGDPYWDNISTVASSFTEFVNSLY